MAQEELQESKLTKAGGWKPTHGCNYPMVGWPSVILTPMGPSLNLRREGTSRPSLRSSLSLSLHSNNTQLLVQMVKEGWFQEPAAQQGSFRALSGSEAYSSNLSNPFGSRTVATSVKQQLGPAFLAAAAAGDVEAGKVLLSYCPDLLNYALWNSPADIRETVMDDRTWIYRRVFSLPGVDDGSTGPFLEVLPFVSKLHKAGFKGLKLTERPDYVLDRLCHHNQRHQPELVQMLLDLGMVSSQACVGYRPSNGLSLPNGQRWDFARHCPIIAVAVAEQNAGAVAVLVAAGAVLPPPGQQALGQQLLPFNYNDLQAVLKELEQQAAAGGRMAVQCGAAADAVRAYCEEHGQEKIEGGICT